ncbi:MAG: hypothetical protein AAF530_02620 [Pseudomonadota bacterium]
MQVAASVFLILALHVAVLDGNTPVFLWALLAFGSFQIVGRNQGGSAVLGFFFLLLSIVGLVMVTQGIELARTAIFLPPILINALLLWIFASSLRSGSEPLISRFRRIQIGWSNGEIDRYTRRLTTLWSFFFAACLLAALVMPFLVAPPTWSWTLNVVCPAISIGFFVLEHLYRAWRLPHFGPVSILQTLSTLSQPRVWREPIAPPK